MSRVRFEAKCPARNPVKVYNIFRDYGEWMKLEPGRFRWEICRASDYGEWMKLEQIRSSFMDINALRYGSIFKQKEKEMIMQFPV